MRARPAPRIAFEASDSGSIRQPRREPRPRLLQRLQRLFPQLPDFRAFLPDVGEDARQQHVGGFVVPALGLGQLGTVAQGNLVEVAPNSDPPVCRIMDYGKFVFEQSKKAQSAKRKQKQTHVKEVKFRPGTEEGDYQVKLRNLVKFLTHGDKTKVTLRFRGREMAHQDLGMKLLLRVRDELEEIAKVEFEPKLEGRQMIMVMVPR